MQGETVSQTWAPALISQLSSTSGLEFKYNHQVWYTLSPHQFKAVQSDMRDHRPDDFIQTMKAMERLCFLVTAG